MTTAEQGIPITIQLFGAFDAERLAGLEAWIAQMGFSLHRREDGRPPYFHGTDRGVMDRIARMLWFRLPPGVAVLWMPYPPPELVKMHAVFQRCGGEPVRFPSDTAGPDELAEAQRVGLLIHPATAHGALAALHHAQTHHWPAWMHPKPRA